MSNTNIEQLYDYVLQQTAAAMSSAAVRSNSW